MVSAAGATAATPSAITNGDDFSVTRDSNGTASSPAPTSSPAATSSPAPDRDQHRRERVNRTTTIIGGYYARPRGRRPA